MGQRLILAIVLTLGCGAPCLAGPYQDALAAYQARDYVTAARLMHAEAENANADAQQFLGFVYHDGEGVPKDDVRSYMWFFLAASLHPGDSKEFADAMAARDMTGQSMTAAQKQTATDLAYKCQAAHYKTRAKTQ